MTSIARNESTNAYTANVSEDSLPAHIVIPLAIIVALMTVATLTGNVLVCLAVLLVRKLRQPGNYLLVSLAVADFMVAAVLMPFAFAYSVYGRWRWGEWLCDFWTSADVLLCTASILNLCAISVDRYWAITKPLTYAASQRTTKRMVCYIAIVWVLAFCVSVVPLFSFHRPRSEGVCQVSQNVFYQIYATLGSFYVPTFIMLMVNYSIYRAARRITRLDQTASASMAMNLNTAGLVAVEIEMLANASDTTTPVTQNDYLQVYKPGCGGGGEPVASAAAAAREGKQPPLSSSAYQTAVVSAPVIDHSEDDTADGDDSSTTPASSTTACVASCLPSFLQLRQSTPPPPRPTAPKPGGYAKKKTAKHSPHCHANNNMHIVVGNGPPLGRRLEAAGKAKTRRRSTGAGCLCCARRGSREAGGRTDEGGPTRKTARQLAIPFVRRLTSVVHWKSQHMTGGEGKAMKTLSLIMGAFITCWLPFFVLALIKPLVCGRRQCVPAWLDVPVLWLGYVNSTLNPLIYAKYNRDFRIPFREMLCCRFSTLKTVLRNEAFCERYGPTFFAASHAGAARSTPHLHAADDSQRHTAVAQTAADDRT